jgi:hypothetical protein
MSNRRHYTTPEGHFGGIFALIYLLTMIITESIFHPKKDTNIFVKKNGNGSSKIVVSGC